MPVAVYTIALVFTVQFTLSELEVFRGQCLRTGLFQASGEDKALVGFKLDTHQVQDEIDCGRVCLSYEGCISYNYEYKANYTKRQTCELNSQTKESRPAAFKEKDGFQYFGSLNKRQKGVGCEKYTCYNGGTCVDTCYGDMFYCQCTEMYRGKQCERPKARSCKELLELGVTKDGSNQVAPDDEDNGIVVWCDQTTDGGGWTVFQRRSSPFTTLFSKTWAEYEAGFSHSVNSIWLGNKHLSRLTKTPVQLRVELRDSTNHQGYAVYENFSISSPEDNYRLSVGVYSKGTIVDAFHDSVKGFEQDGMQFTTSDRDNDKNGLGSCAVVNGASGWWFNNCGRANLNQAYIPQWDGWLYSSTISYTEMKIR
ncbi:fibrinogen-like protein 1 [Oculina patagonica]